MSIYSQKNYTPKLDCDRVSCYNAVILMQSEFEMDFKDKVKAARLKLFMPQEEFAKELGVSFATVNRWENEKVSPSLKAQKSFHEFCKKNNINFEA